MKKTLIALALLGAMSSTAFAQTTVSISGVIDTAFTRDNNGVTSTNSMQSGNQLGSRLIFKGSEDLGGGLRASFMLENGFNADTGALGQGGLLFGRQEWVGLSGDFGSVKLGRQYTPIWEVYAVIDPMGLGLTGATSNFAAGAGAGGVGAGGTGAGIFSLFSAGSYRENNTIKYSFASNGLATDLAYGVGGVAGSTDDSRELGLDVSYTRGPFYIGYAFDNQNNPTSTDNKVSNTIGTTYDFGVVKLHGAWEKNKGSASTAADVNNTDWMVGITVPVGPHTFIGSYQWNDNKVGTDSNSAQLGFAYKYAFSKLTNLYVTYSHNTNQSNASVNAGGLGLTDNMYQIGLCKKF